MTDKTYTLGELTDRANFIVQDQMSALASEITESDCDDRTMQSDMMVLLCAGAAPLLVKAILISVLGMDKTPAQARKYILDFMSDKFLSDEVVLSTLSSAHSGAGVRPS